MNVGTLLEDDRGESEQGGFYSSTGLVREASYLPAGMLSIHARHHMRDAYELGVRAGVRLPCDVMFGALPDKKASTTD